MANSLVEGHLAFETTALFHGAMLPSYSQLCEYVIPADLRNLFKAFLTSDKVGVQCIHLSKPSHIFILLYYYTKWGGVHLDKVQGTRSEDLLLELAASLDEVLDEEEEVPRGPHL